MSAHPIKYNRIQRNFLLTLGDTSDATIERGEALFTLINDELHAESVR